MSNKYLYSDLSVYSQPNQIKLINGSFYNSYSYFVKWNFIHVGNRFSLFEKNQIRD